MFQIKQEVEKTKNLIKMRISHLPGEMNYLPPYFLPFTAISEIHRDGFPHRQTLYLRYSEILTISESF